MTTTSSIARATFEARAQTSIEAAEATLDDLEAAVHALANIATTDGPKTGDELWIERFPQRAEELLHTITDNNTTPLEDQELALFLAQMVDPAEKAGFEAGKNHSHNCRYSKNDEVVNDNHCGTKGFLSSVHDDDDVSGKESHHFFVRQASFGAEEYVGMGLSKSKYPTRKIIDNLVDCLSSDEWNINNNNTEGQHHHSSNCTAVGSFVPLPHLPWYDENNRFLGSLAVAVPVVVNDSSSSSSLVGVVIGAISWSALADRMGEAFRSTLDADQEGQAGRNTIDVVFRAPDLRGSQNDGSYAESYRLWEDDRRFVDCLPPCSGRAMGTHDKYYPSAGGVYGLTVAANLSSTITATIYPATNLAWIEERRSAVDASILAGFLVVVGCAIAIGAFLVLKRRRKANAGESTPVQNAGARTSNDCDVSSLPVAVAVPIETNQTRWR